jgi:hypothetical protein
MAALPFAKRPHDLFVGYSARDAARVNPVVEWLEQGAGLKVWKDSRAMDGGDLIAGSLDDGMASARAAAFFLSESWCASSWCQRELNMALAEERKNGEFRVLPVSLDGVVPPAILGAGRVLDLTRGLDSESAALFLRTLTRNGSVEPDSRKDVYVSRSWRPDEVGAADAVCAALAADGFRPIGDSPDQGTFDASDRVPRLLRTCGAMVACLPRREEPQHGFTSKYVLEEVRLAQSAGLPTLLVADEGVEVDADLLAASLGRRRFRLGQAGARGIGADADGWAAALSLLEDEFRPPKPHAYSFFATSFRGHASEVRRLRVVAQTSGIPCLLGQDLEGTRAQVEIIDRIRHAQFVIADLSEDVQGESNRPPARQNTLLEVGIARGAGTPLHVVCRKDAAERPHTLFMLRDVEIQWFPDDAGRIATVFRLARRQRRRVLAG